LTIAEAVKGSLEFLEELLNGLLAKGYLSQIIAVVFIIVSIYVSVFALFWNFEEFLLFGFVASESFNEWYGSLNTLNSTELLSLLAQKQGFGCFAGSSCF